MMLDKNVGILTFRAFAIYALVRGLIRTSNYIGFLSSKSPEQDQTINQIMLLLQIFGPILLLIIFSIILWKLTPRLTKKVFSDDNQETESTSSTIAIISLILSCIGLYLLIDAIAEVIKSSMAIYALLKYPPISKNMKMYILTTILKFALGFGLLLRGKELVTVLHKERKNF